MTVKLTPRRRRALAKLSRSDRRSLSLSNPITDAVDDLIFGSMGKTLAKLANLSRIMGGNGPGTVEVTEGVTVTLEPTESRGWFGDRLREIDTYAQSIALEHDLDVNEIRGRLLWADGWRVNLRTTKTPPWMQPHREMDSHEVVRLVNLAWFPDIVRWYERKNAQRQADQIPRRRESKDSAGRRVCIADSIVAG